MSGEAEIFAVLGGYAPVLVFLLVTIVVFAVLAKTKVLSDKPFIQLAVAFLAAMMVSVFPDVREYLAKITPWFAVFAVLVFFVLTLIFFAGKEVDVVKQGIGVFLVIAFMLIMTVTFYYSFLKSNSDFTSLIGWVSLPNVFGAFMLLLAGGLAGFILIKSK